MPSGEPVCSYCGRSFRNTSNLRNHLSQPRGQCFRRNRAIREAEIQRATAVGAEAPHTRDRSFSPEVDGVVPRNIPEEEERQGPLEDGIQRSGIEGLDDIDYGYQDIQYLNGRTELSQEEEPFDMDLYEPGIHDDELNHSDSHGDSWNSANSEGGQEGMNETNIFTGTYGLVTDSAQPTDSTQVLHPNESQVFGRGETVLDKFKGVCDQLSEDNMYLPFKGYEEWQFASIVDRLDISIAKVDQLLSSEVVRN
jgi:hypothetical protein